MTDANHNLAVFIAAILIILAPLEARASKKKATCIDWPQAMTQFELNNLPAGTTVLVQPFTDYTKKPGDSWLVLGLRDYLSDLLRTGRDLRVLAGLAAIYGTAGGPPDYIIVGKFQHMDRMLRVFISLSDGKSGQLIKQYDVAVSYPGNREFFTALADSAEQIMKQMKARPKGDQFKAVRDATESTSAYENYSKGRQSLESYDIKKAEIALIWFDQTKSLDYRSPLGYQGTIEVLTFMGFYHKQRREPFGSYFQKAEEELVKMAKLARPAPLILPRKNVKVTKKMGKMSIELENRFLVGNVAFTEGLHAAQKGNWAEAAQAFKKSLEVVPEDAMTWYHLARIEATLGNTAESQDALRKALEINSCLERL